MASQCPKCLSHQQHIFTIEISPATTERWRVERCPACDFTGWANNPELERDYHDRLVKAKLTDEGGSVWQDSDKWRSGL